DGHVVDELGGPQAGPLRRGLRLEQPPHRRRPPAAVLPAALVIADQVADDAVRVVEQQALHAAVGLRGPVGDGHPCLLGRGSAVRISTRPWGPSPSGNRTVYSPAARREETHTVYRNPSGDYVRRRARSTSRVT